MPAKYPICAANKNWNGDSAWYLVSDDSPTTDPTSADDMQVKATSFPNPGVTLTVNSAAYCLGMDWTGATNSPTFTGSQALSVYGNFTKIAALTWTYSGNLIFMPPAADKIATFNGALNGVVSFGNTGTAATAFKYTLQDQLDIGTNTLALGRNRLYTNGQTVTCGAFSSASNSVKEMNLGASIVNCTSWSIATTGLTWNAGTSSIRITGTGAFTGGTITYYELQLNGSAHTISGSNTFAALTLPAATTQTITFTAGTRQTITTATLSGDATHTHTLKSETAGTLASIWATNKTDSYVTYTDMLRNYNGVIVVNCSGAGGGTFAGGGGTFTSMLVEGAGNYALTITGNNIFTGAITVDRSVAAKTILATGGTTQTFSHFICDVSGTRTLTIGSTDTTPVIFTKNGLSVLLDYVALTYNTGSPANKWYYGVNSTAGAGVTGWAAEATRISELKLVIMIPLASLIGKAGKAIIVNATEDGFTIETQRGITPMPDNGIDWTKRFGKAANEMDDGEWRMAVSVLLCETASTCKDVPAMKIFYKLAIWALPIVVSILLALGAVFFNHLNQMPK